MNTAGCVAFEWSSHSTDPNTKASCAFAWGCDKQKGWSGGDVFLSNCARAGISFPAFDEAGSYKLAQCPAVSAPKKTPDGLYVMKTWHSSMTFDQAVSYCRENYHDLASVHTAGQNDEVRKLCDQSPAPVVGCWLGGSDNLKEGVWVWSDGTSFNYHNFAAGEPNGNVNENKLHIWASRSGRQDGSWNDARNAFEKSYNLQIATICSTRATVANQPQPQPKPACGAGAIAG